MISEIWYKTAEKILATDAQSVFKKLDLSAHLTPQRSNGVRSMVERIKTEARMAAAAVGRARRPQKHCSGKAAPQLSGNGSPC